MSRFARSRIVSDVDVTCGCRLPRATCSPDSVVSVDRGNVVAQAEYVQRRNEMYYNIVAANGWYVMGGYRFGTITPYAIVSKTDPLYLGHSSADPVCWCRAVSNDQSTVALGAALGRVRRRLRSSSRSSAPTPMAASGVSFSGPVSSPVTVVSAAYVLTF